MTTSQLLRWAGMATLFGGVLAIMLAPPFALAYFVAYPGHETPPRWLMALRPSLASLLTFAPASVVYATYGKLYTLVYILFLPGAFGVHHFQRAPERILERRSFRLLVLALITTILGVAGDYWADGAGFLVEILGLFLLLLTTTLYGIATLRLAVLPRWSAWGLVAAGIAGIATTLAVGHVPSGPTIPVAFAWASMGFLLWAQFRPLLRAPGYDAG